MAEWSLIQKICANSREKTAGLSRTIAALCMGLLIGAAILLAVSKNPQEALRAFLWYPLDSMRHIGNIAEGAIPLIFTGLAVSVLFEGKLFNMGSEGVFFISAVAASWVAISVESSPIFHQSLAIILGGVVGGAVMLIPAIPAARFRASELVSSLLLNSILLGLGRYIFTEYLRDTDGFAMVSKKFANSARLPVIIGGTRVHFGLVIATFCALLTYVLLRKTVWGYELRMSGKNPIFAANKGIGRAHIIITAHIVAGGLAGIGGAVETIGLHSRFEWSALPGFGFDGILIALLAQNNPIGVVAAAFFVSYLRTGADMLARFSDVPSEMIMVVQGAIILLISAQRFFWGHKKTQLTQTEVGA